MIDMIQKLNQAQTLSEARAAVASHGLAEATVNRLAFYMDTSRAPFPPEQQMEALRHLRAQVPELALGVSEGRIDYYLLREAFQAIERDIRRDAVRRSSRRQHQQ